MSPAASKLSLFPLDTRIGPDGHLCIGNCDVVDLVRTFGTPLYVFHEPTIRSTCRNIRSAFTAAYDDTLVLYASKAFLNPALARIIKEEELGLDVVSGGEISIAQSVAFPARSVYFHGNNKTPQELTRALEWGIGRVVVDNLDEADILETLCKQSGRSQDVLLRINPGVDPHTHHKTSTGVLDSKFGLPLATGQAEQAAEHLLSLPSLNLQGIHFHLGSPIFDPGPYERALEGAVEFAGRMFHEHGLDFREMGVGGGFAVDYTLDSHAPPPAVYARSIVSRLKSLVSDRRLPLPKLVVEPGRIIVARAGVALYTVGVLKEIPGIRHYVSVDGGMSDNIRPALYGSRYEIINGTRASDEETNTVTVVGKLCESGDVLANDVAIAPPRPGDVLAMPASGAYSIPMGSNYNGQLRPAIVLIDQHGSRLIRQRESYEDLTRLDLW